jgi:hypothetical protein
MYKIIGKKFARFSSQVYMREGMLKTVPIVYPTNVKVRRVSRKKLIRGFHGTRIEE